MFSIDELVQPPREEYFGVYLPSCLATREMYNKITGVSAKTFRHESTYIILFLTRHNESMNDDKTTIF